MSEPPIVPQRSPPAGGLSVSAISLSVHARWAGGSAVPPLLEPMLRRARELGVTCFDLVDAPHPALAAEALARAFPSDDPQLVVVVPDPEPDATAFRPRSPVDRRATGGAPLASVEELLERLGPHRRVVLERTRTAHPRALPPPRKATASVVGVAERIDAERWRSDPGLRGLCSGRLSIVEPDLVEVAEGMPAVPQVALLARDVWATGALDGSLLDPTPLAGPGAGPVDIAALEARLGPVLRLGYLTRGRSRTLAQAAIQFVLRWPWVLSAVVPLPPPERLDSVLRAASLGTFTDEDLRGLGGAFGSSAPPSGPARPPLK